MFSLSSTYSMSPWCSWCLGTIFDYSYESSVTSSNSALAPLAVPSSTCHILNQLSNFSKTPLSTDARGELPYLFNQFQIFPKISISLVAVGRDFMNIFDKAPPCIFNDFWGFGAYKIPSCLRTHKKNTNLFSSFIHSLRMTAGLPSRSNRLPAWAVIAYRFPGLGISPWRPVWRGSSPATDSTTSLSWHSLAHLWQRRRCHTWAAILCWGCFFLIN